MRNNRTTHTLKGFTLIEMIIVIGIIGILLGVFVPTVTGYYNNSRLNTANSNAKVIFNSAQTICQEFEFLDRNAANGAFYGAMTDANGVDHAVTTGAMMIHSESGNITGAWLNGTSDATLLSNLTNGLPDASKTADQQRISAFQNRFSRLFADNAEVNWYMFIEDYTVSFVVCAANESTDALGSFPRKSTERGELFASLGDITYPTLQARANNPWA